MRRTRLILISALAPLLVTGAATLKIRSIKQSVHPPPPPSHVIHNVTGLHSSPVAALATPTSIEELRTALLSHHGPISLGGGRFSQGGQIGHPDSLHIDLRGLNQILHLDHEARTITVQSGATWRQIQEQINPHGLSVRIMQTYANFTVGGSLSVNVHGRYIGEGPLIRSVREIHILLADGSLHTASPEKNPDLFYAAIGGYGGIGIITQATLNLTSNTPVERHSRAMPLQQYLPHFASQIRSNPEAIFSNGDIYPPDFQTIRSVTWYRSTKPLTSPESIRPKGASDVGSPRIIDLLAHSDCAKKLRRIAIEPLLHLSHPVVWRNNEASYDVSELPHPIHEDHTYGLREYFVPPDHFHLFVDRMRSIFARHQVNVINVSVRHALPDPGSLLAWAQQEVFAFVVYYRQGLDSQEQERVREWSREMIDAANTLGGSYYLPYQIHESPAQFRAAYPNADRFCEVKRRVDPDNRFRNTLIDHIVNPDDRPDTNAIPNYRGVAGEGALAAAHSWMHHQPASMHVPDNSSRTQQIRELWLACETAIQAAKHRGFPGSHHLNALRRSAWWHSFHLLMTPLIPSPCQPTLSPNRTLHLLISTAPALSKIEGHLPIVMRTNRQAVTSTPSHKLLPAIHLLLEHGIPLLELNGMKRIAAILETPSRSLPKTLQNEAFPLCPTPIQISEHQFLHFVDLPIAALPDLQEHRATLKDVFP
jgi:FAD/FMN-containing dehydrogenase